MKGIRCGRKTILALAILVAASGFAFSTAIAGGGTLVVNTADDNDDGICDGNHCSLHEAIDLANSLPGVQLAETSTGNTIGGATQEKMNLISGA